MIDFTASLKERKMIGSSFHRSRQPPKKKVMRITNREPRVIINKG